MQQNALSGVLAFGGGGGIRTLERLSAVIRFPVVRARPGYATPPLREIQFIIIRFVCLIRGAAAAVLIFLSRAARALIVSTDLGAGAAYSFRLCRTAGLPLGRLLHF